MKKIIYTIFVLAAIFSSCVKDEGNYTYKDVNEVIITGIDPVYVRSVRDTINITPNLEFTKDANPDMDNYSFEWIDLIGNTPLERGRNVLLATTKDLVDFQLPSYMTSNNPDRWVGPGQDSNPAVHTIVYRITDKRTGITSSQYFGIRILPAGNTGNIDRGIMILCDVGGKMRLDMLSFNSANSDSMDYLFTYRRDVLGYMDSKFPDDQLASKPRQVMTCYQGTTNYIFVLTDTGANLINSRDFSWKSSYNITRYSVFFPENYAPERMYGMSPTTFVYMTGKDDEGKFAFFDWYGNTISWTYTKPINRYDSDTGPKFNPSPVTIVLANSTGILYDQDTKGFVRHLVQSSVFCTRPTGVETYFPWADPTRNRELFYMGLASATGTGLAYAFYTDKSTGKIEYVSFDSNFLQLSREEITGAPELQDAVAYSMHQSRASFFYYLNKDQDKIYRLKFIDKSTEVVYEAPAGYKVSIMGFTPTNQAKDFNGINRLSGTAVYYEQFPFYICTYDPNGKEGENGVLEAYVSNPADGKLSLYEHVVDSRASAENAGNTQPFRFENIGKVVSLDYKTLTYNNL